MSTNGSETGDDVPEGLSEYRARAVSGSMDRPMYGLLEVATLGSPVSSVTRKNRQMSIKVAQK